MSAEPVTPPAPPQAATRPSLTVTWDGPGAAAMTIEAPNVTSAQLYGAAWLLDAMAREVRAGEVARAAMGGLVTDPAALLDQLRKTGRL